MGNPAQQLFGKSRGHPCQKPGHQIDSRTPRTLYHHEQPDLAQTVRFGGGPGAWPGAHLSLPNHVGKDTHSSAGLVKNHYHSSRSNTSLYQPPPLMPAQEGYFFKGCHKQPNFTEQKERFCGRCCPSPLPQGRAAL